MSFEEILEQALAMLQRHGRVSYRGLQRQFALDKVPADCRPERRQPRTIQRASGLDSQRPGCSPHHWRHDGQAWQNSPQRSLARRNTSARDRSDRCRRRSAASSAIARCAPAIPAGPALARSERRGHSAPAQSAPPGASPYVLQAIDAKRHRVFLPGGRYLWHRHPQKLRGSRGMNAHRRTGARTEGRS